MESTLIWQDAKRMNYVPSVIICLMQNALFCSLLMVWMLASGPCSVIIVSISYHFGFPYRSLFCIYLRIFTKYQRIGSVIDHMKHLVPLCYGRWTAFFQTLPVIRELRRQSSNNHRNLRYPSKLYHYMIDD